MRPPSDATIAAFRKWIFGIIGPGSGVALFVAMVLNAMAFGGRVTTEMVAAAGALTLLKLGDTPPSPPSPPTGPPPAS